MEVGDGVSAIATLIAAWIAIRTFNKWTNQKGSEVIASEAKTIFKLVEEIPSSLNKVHEDMLNMVLHNKVPNDFDESRFTNFRKLNVEIMKSLKLIEYKNKDKDTLKITKNFSDCYKNYGSNYCRSKIDLKEILETKELYDKSLTDLKNEMYEYALYKKTI